MKKYVLYTLSIGVLFYLASSIGCVSSSEYLRSIEQAHQQGLTSSIQGTLSTVATGAESIVAPKPVDPNTGVQVPLVSQNPLVQAGLYLLSTIIGGAAIYKKNQWVYRDPPKRGGP